MKKIIIYCLALFLLFSCANNEFNVELGIDANFIENDLKITGSTNLPDGAMISLNLKPLYEEEVSIKDGKIEHTFSFNGDAIPDGDYTLEAIFIPTQNESPKLKNMILIENENVYEKDGIKYYYIGNNFNINKVVKNKELKNLINRKVPYEKWNDWGNPETLEQTNNIFWAAYLEKADISFISKKENDKIIFACRGKEKLEKYFTDRQNNIEIGFSLWDGSHKKLTELIKQSMNDAKSYEHVKTVYWDKGDHLIVKTDFRGANVFGGIVLDSVTAKTSIDGEILEIISD